LDYYNPFTTFFGGMAHEKCRLREISGRNTAQQLNYFNEIWCTRVCKPHEWTSTY